MTTIGSTKRICAGNDLIFLGIPYFHVTSIGSTNKILAENASAYVGTPYVHVISIDSTNRILAGYDLWQIIDTMKKTFYIPRSGTFGKELKSVPLG